MITLEDYFGKVSHIEEPTLLVQGNATILLGRVNALLAQCAAIEAAANPVVTSGWRPASYNAKVPNAAPRSKHITGEAIDLADPEGELDEFLLDNPHILSMSELWMEHPLATKSWCHLQSMPPRSGNRVFYP